MGSERGVCVCAMAARLRISSLWSPAWCSTPPKCWYCWNVFDFSFTNNRDRPRRAGAKQLLFVFGDTWTTKWQNYTSALPFFKFGVMPKLSRVSKRMEVVTPTLRKRSPGVGLVMPRHKSSIQTGPRYGWWGGSWSKRAYGSKALASRTNSCKPVLARWSWKHRMTLARR